MTSQIAPDIGAQLITALANQAKIVEIDELTRRMSYWKMALQNRVSRFEETHAAKAKQQVTHQSSEEYRQ